MLCTPMRSYAVKLGGVPVKDEILRPSNIFVAMYIIIFAVASLLLAIISYDDPRMNIETIHFRGGYDPGQRRAGPGIGGADVQLCRGSSRRKDAPLLMHVDRPAGDHDGTGFAGAGVLEEVNPGTNLYLTA